MVSHLVAKDERTRTSEEKIVSGSKGPDVCEEHGIFQTFSLLFYNFLLFYPPHILFS